jgi:eukaryotic-like serine/threonine-protein kinase
MGDDRGTVSIVDLQGHRRVLTEEYSATQGLVWSLSGKEIWFTAGFSGGHFMALQAVDLEGKTRTLASTPIRMHLEDIAPDGRVLVTTESMHWDFGIGDGKTGRTQGLTTFTHPFPAAISNDGSTVLMNGFDVVGSSNNYRLYLQRTDGSAPVQIGEGAGSAFSPDGKLVAAINPARPEQAVVIPTGIGDSRTVQAAVGRHYEGMAFLSDNRHLLITTNGGQGRGSAVQDLSDGSVRPIGPAGRSIPHSFNSLDPGASPDGKFCIESDDAGRFWLQPLDGSAAREITGIQDGETIISWHNDAGNVFLAHPDGADIDLYTLNLATGERKLWIRFSPIDKAATFGNSAILITPDGAHFAYIVHRLYSNLFIVTGVR